MVFAATFWVALVNLVLLVIALALHPASLEGLYWLRDLPWAWFGTELLGVFEMHAVDAGALWALWISVSGVLLGGSTLAYAALALSGSAAPTRVAAEPRVTDLFSDLSSGMSGLGGFGNPDLRDLGATLSKSSPALQADALDTVHDAPAASDPAPAVKAPDIVASLQQIDPQLRASYDALLRELTSDRST